MKIIFLVFISLFLASSACAQNNITPTTPCKPHMQEEVSISVNFNFNAPSFTEAKALFDEKTKQVANFAQEQHVKKFSMQSMNYNIANNGIPEELNINGNASYSVDSTNNALKIAEFLKQKKFQVSVTVGGNNQDCSN